MSMGISQTAMLGVQRGMAGMQEAASDIASASSFADGQAISAEKAPSKSLTESLVSLKQNEQATQASLQVLKANDDMLGAVLDVFA